MSILVNSIATVVTVIAAWLALACYLDYVPGATRSFARGFYTIAASALLAMWKIWL